MCVIEKSSGTGSGAGGSNLNGNCSGIVDIPDENLKPYVKSEPIPEVNNESVKVVVRDSIQDLVFNSGKNALLEFYVPWGGHCKKLAPILDEVAVSFENDPDVVIAKFYQGDGIKADLIEFVQKNRDTNAKPVSVKSEPSIKLEPGAKSESGYLSYRWS
ncbi:hypothetical protein AgCh_038418 [Apium graveolens]